MQNDSSFPKNQKIMRISHKKSGMRRIVQFALLFCSVNAWGQSVEIPQIIDPSNLNIHWLEHLVKIKVDSVRKAHGLGSLANDSVCYLSALDQASFVSGLKNLSHFQEIKRKKTPQDRVNFYGATNYNAGENLIRIYVQAPSTSTDKKRKLNRKIIIRTYEDAAFEMANGWVNSPEHFKNMLIPSYKITGLAISFNPETHELNSAQVFANVPSYFIPVYAASLFPFDKDYFPNPSIQNTNPGKEVHKEHAWDISMEASSRDLAAWDYYKSNLEFSGLAVVNRTIIFNGGKYKAAEQFLTGRNDGMMAEVVPFSRYNCSLDEYTSLPGRRNGECIFNGIALRPLYRHELLNTNFWGKVPDKKPRKLTMALGKIPLSVGEPNEINVLVLKHRNICGLIQFHHLRDTLFQYTTKLSYLGIPKLKPCGCYKPSETSRNEYLQFFYAVNKTDPDENKIKNIQHYLSNPDIKIEKISIRAYASIEGNFGINNRLYQERARIIHDSIRAWIPGQVTVSESTGENWAKFRDQTRLNPRYSYLTKLDSLSIRKIMNDSATTGLKGFLDAQRFSEVDIQFRNVVPEEKIIPYAVNEYLAMYLVIKKRWNSLGSGYQARPEDLDRMEKILDFLMQNILDKKAEYTLIDTLPLLASDNQKPEVSWNDPLSSLLARKMQFDLSYRPEEVDESYRYRIYCLFTHLPKPDPLMEYNYQAFLINHFEDPVLPGFHNRGDLKKLKEVIQASTSLVEKAQLDQMNLFYHFAKSLEIAKIGVDKFAEANPSLNFIHDYFICHACDDSYRIKLALFFLSFQKYKLATDLLDPIVIPGNRDKEAYILWLKIHYAQTGIENLPFSEYQLLFEAADWLPPEDFCRLFEADDRINFQILDYEPLHTLYCKLKNKVSVK
jgi:hypothetical protein